MKKIRLILIMGLWILLVSCSNEPVQNEIVQIEIPENSSVNDIIDILKDNNIIKNKLLFKLKLKKDGRSGELKAGNYRIEKNASDNDIIESLVEGSPADTVRFTIPEGFELDDIANKLSEEDLVDKMVFLNLTKDKALFEKEFVFLKELDDNQSLEGFLFPSTYEVFKNSSEEEIIKKMLEGFESIYLDYLKGKVENSNLNLNEIVTLASIIEREGKIDSERPLMSAVFYNRIDKNIPLGSCATVQYIIGERKPVLSEEDTRIESPYNTYIHYGLPPAPIAAPGKISLIAAVEPANVDYLYFTLTGEDGSHTFTKTYEEHLKAGKGN